MRDELLAELTPQDCDYLMSRWDKKFQLCTQGDMRWGMSTAENAP